MITKFHISQGEIDDEISKKLVKRFFKVLDPQKLYLLQSDIDEFSIDQTQLDDQLKQGNVSFTYAVYNGGPSHRRRLKKQAMSSRELKTHRFVFGELNS